MLFAFMEANRCLCSQASEDIKITQVRQGLKLEFMEGFACLVEETGLHFRGLKNN